MSVLEAQNLDFAYAADRPAILDASIAVERGSMTAIIGANGCGKSTLVRMLAGILRPDRGKVLYRGKDLAAHNRRQLARELAYVAQSVSRAFPFTALEVVLTGRTPHTSPYRLENLDDARLALAALEQVGVLHLAERRITELSGGERQLVSVARALAQQPKCLLLDEPSASLDLKHRAGLIRMLSEKCRRSGLTVVMVTHDLTLLDPGFDAVFAMRCGSIVASGAATKVLREDTLAEVFDDPYIRSRRVDGQLCVWSEVHLV
jgi:iron complex transport system ATP-binding protein